MSHLHDSHAYQHLPVGRFPRHLFDFDNFLGMFIDHDERQSMTCFSSRLGPSLDLFDPFDETDLSSHRMQSALQYVECVDCLILLFRTVHLS
jgi:hypothetical protein